MRKQDPSFSELIESNNQVRDELRRLNDRLDEMPSILRELDRLRRAVENLAAKMTNRARGHWGG